MIEKYKKEGDIREDLGDDEQRIQLEIEKHTFEPKQKSDISGYFSKVRDCGLSVIDICEKRYKKELEKSASHIKSIIEIF